MAATTSSLSSSSPEGSLGDGAQHGCPPPVPVPPRPSTKVTRFLSLQPGGCCELNMTSPAPSCFPEFNSMNALKEAFPPRPKRTRGFYLRLS